MRLVEYSNEDGPLTFCLNKKQHDHIDATGYDQQEHRFHL